MTLIEDADYFIRLVELPYGVHGAIMKNDDGTYSVYLSARDTRERRKQACDHERKHIIFNDLEKESALEAEGL